MKHLAARQHQQVELEDPFVYLYKGLMCLNIGLMCLNIGLIYLILSPMYLNLSLMYLNLGLCWLPEPEKKHKYIEKTMTSIKKKTLKSSMSAKRSQGLPRGGQNSAKSSQDGPKSGPRASKRSPRRL